MVTNFVGVTSEESLVTVMVSPPVGAGAFKDRVPVRLLLPMTGFAEKSMDATPGGFTPMVVLRVKPLRVAEIWISFGVAIAFVLIWNCAEVWPWLTCAEAGTDAVAGSALDKL